MTTGVAYPLAISDGALVLVNDRDSQAAQAIRSAVQTYQGERLMRQKYGIKTRPFDEANLPNMLADVQAAVALALAGFSPPVKYRVTGQLLTDGYEVYIDYLSLTDEQYLTEVARLAFV